MPIIIVVNEVATKFRYICQLSICRICIVFTGTLSVLHVITRRAACIELVTAV